MATRKPKATAAPKDTTSSKRVPPVKMMRAQVAPHPKTLANGKPRPKKRG